MVAVNTEVKQPESPPKDWGVTPRKRTPKDYIYVFIFSILTVLAAAYAYSPSTFGSDIARADRPWLWGLSAVLGCVTLFIFSNDPGGAYREADEIANEKSNAWQKDVLIPYLEKRYGITFRSEGSLFGGWGFPMAYKDNQTIEVSIHGVKSERKSFDPQSDSVFRYFRNFEVTTIWLEEVIRPDQIRFRALEEANADDSQS